MTDYQIWTVSKRGRLVDFVEGAVVGTWTKKTAMREYGVKYQGCRFFPLKTSERYAVVKVTSEVVTP